MPAKAVFIVWYWPRKVTLTDSGRSLSSFFSTFCTSSATAPRSRPCGVAKTSTMFWMLYCDTTAGELSRLSLPRPPRTCCGPPRVEETGRDDSLSRLSSAYSGVWATTG